jgi:hypothetical protein
MSTLAGVRGPLSIGDIADRSVTLAVRHWRTLFALVLIDAIPFGFVRIAMPDDTGMLMMRWLLPDLVLITLLYTAGIMTAVAADIPSPRTVLASAVPFFWKALAAIVLAYAYFAAAAVVALIAGGLVAVLFGLGTRNALIAGAVGASVAALVVLPPANLVCMIAMPVMIVERLSPWTAYTRSIGRVRRTGFVRAWLLGLAALALFLVPGLMLTSVADYVVGTLHLAVFRLVEQLLNDSMTLVFGTVFVTVAALEIRARTEGTDLEEELGRSEAAFRTL